MIKAVIFDMYETLITHYDNSLYFSKEMAEDVDIPYEKFYSMWKNTDKDRTCGKMKFEEIIEQILRANDCYSDENLKKIFRNRVACKRENFKHLHKEIIPMLQALKEREIKIGLVSNCFSEEAMVIRESVLFPYFDAICLSYEEGIAKPNHEIFLRCTERLGVEPEECMYVGDGGSNELAAAKELNMYPLQAVWYLKEGTFQPTGPMEKYLQLKTPLDIIKEIK